MKLFLDDTRDAPDGWVRVYWPNSVISFIEKGIVSHVSLDHDLGHDKVTGYDVITWLEQKVLENPSFVIPVITIHSANPIGKKKMHKGLDAIYRMKNA